MWQVPHFEELKTKPNIKPTDLDLSVPPKFNLDKIQKTIYLKVGGGTAIEIPFSAYPMPDAEWKFKGGRLPDAKRMKTDMIIGMSSLVLSKVKRSDSGDYSIELENEFGKASVSVKVIVQGT